MSRRRQQVAVDKLPKRTDTYLALQAGRRIVQDKNCHGCHYFDGDGGAIAQYWDVGSDGQPVFAAADGKEMFDYLQDVPGPTRGHVPPVLLDQGNKTLPPWLFKFLQNPTRLRPQIRMRMPTFSFGDVQANALVHMFAALEGHGVGEETSYAPDPALALVGQELLERGKCVKCHMFTDVDPAVVPASVVAPNLKLTRARLQHTWTPRWLADPQSIMPGANMPNFFDMESKSTALDTDGTLLDGDLELGMRAITDYLIVSGESYKGAETASR
jgi:mono/diheme cytochrome c family protein